ncbi:hypothetical protein H310_01742 [Aphanomyces invadans]|uniref:Uncharacterized protein n=1 Tax=Aphanomyces invadans TaxID=157072 RepID=A0A024ULB5_9STRA|nr:hypothetical protein H310_01742 [Aphanomyces invadans]ETW07099.1 hypothetical protein H310_01742 [Aphanomyces invadans]|eukprot:XP_008863192.1 hypothetical protein H310_01742 [Aphanomyces invadans]
MWGVVHLDEKWFNAYKDRQKVHLVKGQTIGRRTSKSKRFIAKVMFLAAVSHPRFDCERGVMFDGKFGMWPIAKRVPAARNSRNRPAGTLVTTVVNVDAAVCCDFVMTRVIPANKARIPSSNKQLGFFASIQSLQSKVVSRSVDGVISLTLAAFLALCSEKLGNVFLAFQAVMRLVLEHNGDNRFRLPHLKKDTMRRAGTLMTNVTCPVSLLD